MFRAVLFGRKTHQAMSAPATFGRLPNLSLFRQHNKGN